MPTTLYAADGTYLRFDAVESLRRTANVAVSSHPTERIGLVADNAQAEPIVVSFLGIITASPLTTQVSAGGVTSGLTGEARERAAVDWLLEHRLQRLTLTTDRREPIDDLVITSIPDETTVRQERVLQLVLQQVLVAEAGTVRIPPEQPVPSAEPGFSSAEDLGDQTGTSGDQDPEQQARDVSAASLLLDALGL